MNSTHHKLSFELLHVGWHSNLQIFQILLMSGNTLSWGALTQQLAKFKSYPPACGEKKSIAWLAAIESTRDRYQAYYDSLYEIGHDDFESAVEFAELANSVANLDRETAYFEALQSWTLVDPERVKVYLDSSDDFVDSLRFAQLRSGLE